MALGLGDTHLLFLADKLNSKGKQYFVNKGGTASPTEDEKSPL